MCSCSLSLFFFNGTHFQLGGRKHFSFSHRRYEIFMFFFKRNWSSLFFISRSSSFSVIHVNVDIKIQSKERLGFVVVFFSLWKFGWPCDLPPKRAGACNAKFHHGLLEWVDVCMCAWTIFSEPKFFGCIDNQIFLPMVRRYKLNFNDNYWISSNFYLL